MQQTETLSTNISQLRNENAPNWLTNASVLWENRRLMLRTAALGFLVSVLIVILIPNRYESTARIMPPDNSSPGAAMLAALAGKNTGELGGLGNLATSLLGVHTTGPMFVDMLRSASVTGDLIDRFQLQRVYGRRYRMDAAKKLAGRTTIAEDKKSGVISITVEDSDPQRARDMAQAYLDELNLLVNRTSTSSARQERVFIEHRLAGAEADLERAQKDLSDFSSTHTTIDIKEQTRATVDAAAKLQAQLIVEQSELDSLKQIYGDDNYRVRAGLARIVDLKKQLNAIGGNSEPLGADGNIAAQEQTGLGSAANEYPPLRQLPRLAVPFADIYRRVHIQEAVYELLTQQYELARIQEAKDIPVIRMIDAPGIPEKKSFPPRTIYLLLLTGLIVIGAAVWILLRERWSGLDQYDPRKRLVRQITGDLVTLARQWKQQPEPKR
jgi:capsule polysaccharide export protein KpsE/RkpR